MKSKLDSINNSKTGSVKIGVVATAKYFAHKIIAGFIKTNPEIKVYMDRTIKFCRKSIRQSITDRGSRYIKKNV